MRMHKNESPADVTRWLADRSAGRWPAILGSLSLRRSPCIRENCPACRSGEQHPSYVLYGRRKGRRFSVYIPEELVPEGSALFGQRARPSRTVVRGRSAVREGFEARAADDGGTIERLSHVEIRQFAIQLRRLGVVAARSSPGTIARGDRRFPR